MIIGETTAVQKESGADPDIQMIRRYVPIVQGTNMLGGGISKSGDSISIQFTVTPVNDADGRLAGIAAVLRDVTATFLELRRLRAGG